MNVGLGSKLTISNVQFYGGTVGISATDASLAASNVSFTNVEKPYDLKDMRDVTIKKTKIAQDHGKRGGERTFTGWQRTRNGPALPSYCPKCEHVFASQNYDMSGHFFSLWDNEEPCINCGYPSATLSEGHFKLVQQSVQILRAPDITKQMVKRLAELGDAVLSGKLKPDEAIAAAGKIHPALGSAAKILFAGLTGAYFLYASLIGTISATMDAYDRMTGADPAVINQKIVEQALREHDRLWHEKLEQPQGSVVREEPSRKPDKIATSNKSGSKVSNSRSEATKYDKKKQKRKNLKKHRESFGGARSR